jgi:membrane protease YdiL (CAAX protease family)
MFKINLIALIYFILCVIMGLLLSNLLLIFILYLKGTDLTQILADSDSLIYSLSNYELLVSQMSSQIFSLIIPAWIYSRLTANTSEPINRSPFTLEIFFFSLFVFITSIPLVALSAYLNQLIPLTDWMKSTELQMSEMIEKMLNFQSVSDLIIAIIVIAVIPAIAEEWVFRGIVQKQLIGLMRNKWIGLIIASLFFSAIHMQFQGFLPRLVLGLILGFIYMVTGNLWYSILMHFFNNGFQVIGAYFYKEEILKQINNDVELPNAFAIVISIVAFSLSAYYLQQKTKINQHA